MGQFLSSPTAPKTIHRYVVLTGKPLGLLAIPPLDVLKLFSIEIHPPADLVFTLLRYPLLILLPVLLILGSDLVFGLGSILPLAWAAVTAVDSRSGPLPAPRTYDLQCDLLNHLVNSP